MGGEEARFTAACFDTYLGEIRANEVVFMVCSSQSINHITDEAEEVLNCRRQGQAERFREKGINHSAFANEIEGENRFT